MRGSDIITIARQFRVNIIARPFILGHHLFLCPDCGTVSEFPLRWTVLLFRPPRGCHVLSTCSFSLSPSLLFLLSRDGEQDLSLSLSFSLLFLLSPSATVSLATESTVSLSLPLFLSSLSSLPLSDGLSRDGEHGLSLSPSLSLFSFFSPPQRRSLSRRKESAALPSSHGQRIEREREREREESD